jgi:starch phosphorylase
VKDAGWALTDKRTYENQEHQDQLDAATIYSILENEIVPLYYSRNGEDRSTKWIEFIKKSIAEITPIFTTKRMMDDYFDKFYNKLYKRSSFLKENGFVQAKEIAAWKDNMASHWDNIEIAKVQIPEELIHDPHVSKKYGLEVVLDTKDLNDKGIGVELVVLKKNKHHEDILHEVKEMNLASVDGSKMYFNLEYKLNLAGTIKYAFRMFPKNEHLPHRQDFCYVRWF